MVGDKYIRDSLITTWLGAIRRQSAQDGCSGGSKSRAKREKRGGNLPQFWGWRIALNWIVVYATSVKTARVSSSKFAANSHDLRSLLRERLSSAKARNPRFSLRSFAKQLGVDHSTLSQILRSKRRLSPRNLETVGRRLGLSQEVLQLYSQNGRRKSDSGKMAENVRTFHFDLDTFQFLSIWYHYAILELTHVEGFKADSRWIANTLGISVEDVNIALQRLMRLGLLEMETHDRWNDRSGDAEFHSVGLTENASNQINQEIHELAIQAVRRIPGHDRVHRHMVMAFSSSGLPKLNGLVDKFMEELRHIASEVESKDDVFEIEISCFPVTTMKKTKENMNG